MASNVPLAAHPEADMTLEDMWTKAANEIAAIDPARENWKAQPLPVARIKKIMKSEELVNQELGFVDSAQKTGEEGERKANRFMISGEAPVLIGKACEIMVKEITTRAWKHTQRNRRRTLQKPDVHAAVGENEVFDFLIDIVPRVVTTQVMPPPKPEAAPLAQGADAADEAARMAQIQQVEEQMQQAYMVQMQQARMQAEAGQQQQQPGQQGGTTGGVMNPQFQPPQNGMAGQAQWGAQQQAPGMQQQG